MAGIEPARSSSRKRRPAIGLHPESEARRRDGEPPSLQRSARALLVSREIGCHRAVSRETLGNGRPERNRTSDSPLRRRVLFLLSYGSISRARAPLRRFSRPPRARRHERCVPLCLAERAIRLGARLFHVAPAHAGRAADKLLPFERREGRRTLDTQLLMREPRRATGAGDTSLNALPAMNGRAGYTSPIAPVQ